MKKPKHDKKTDNEEMNNYVIELKESDDEIYTQIHLEEGEEEKSSNLDEKELNKTSRKYKSNINGIKTEMNNNIKKNNDLKEKLTFEESLCCLKNSFIEIFDNINCNNNEIYLWKNETFRNSLINNTRMQLIFHFTDILTEIYENHLNTIILEKKCDINRIIDIYINKIIKLSQKRRIVVKDYNNLIYVIGAEIYNNKFDTQAKEFIIKKKTQTFKGKKQIVSDEDECFISEINSNKKKKQSYYDLGDVTMAIIMLVQNLEKNAVNK